MQLPSMAALCGLGNPGEEYIEHRQNIGSLIIYVKNTFPQIIKNIMASFIKLKSMNTPYT